MPDPLQVAVDAAREAGALQRERLRDAGRVEHKGEIDLVTEVDRACEALLVGRLTAAFPDHAVLAEEGGGGRGAVLGQGDLWIIDPLDGTTNYVHGLPYFCVSIGWQRAGALALGVVYDPMREEMFVARAGQGATLNGAPLRVSTTDALIRALLATGFPYDRREFADNNHEEFERFNLASQGARRLGAAALDLCQVACGRLDGFWESQLNPWDMAAGALCILEAGGRVTDHAGGQGWLATGRIVASNGLLHGPMLDVLAGRGGVPRPVRRRGGA